MGRFLIYFINGNYAQTVGLDPNAYNGEIPVETHTAIMRRFFSPEQLNGSVCTLIHTN